MNKNDIKQEIISNIEDLIQPGNKDVYILPQSLNNKHHKQVYNKAERSLREYCIQEDGNWRLFSMSTNVTIDGFPIDKTSTSKFFHENGDKQTYS